MPPDAIPRLDAALQGRYRIERKLGEGGMATVYLARDLKHERTVALKVLRPDLASSLGPERFSQEVRVTANLQHPHILPLFDSGEADGFLFYVMPYLQGESLRDRLDRDGELSVGDAVRILREVADALSAAHRVGVVHRDIKPENVLLSGRHAVVTDFGVAKAVSAAAGRHHLTTGGAAMGTPAYMAPEQATADDHVDQRADIYAVGALGYELLTGRPPFVGNTLQQILVAHTVGSPRSVSELRPAVPDGVASVIMRCLEKRPDDRWQTADELLAQLEAIETSLSGTPPTRIGRRAGAGRRRSWAGVALLGVAGIALVAAGGFWLAGAGERPAEDARRSGGAGGATPDVARLFVMPLDNVTGDSALAVWSVLAAEWIGNAIDRAGSVPVVPATTVREGLAALEGRVSVDSVAGRVTAAYAVAGTLARTGREVRFQVELLDTRTGDRLRALEPVAGPVDSIDVLVARLANASAAAVMATLDPAAPPWVEYTSLPPSVEAFEQHLAQIDLFCRDRFPESIEAGERATRLAPDFVGPIRYLAGAYYQLSRYAISDSILDISESMRDRMTAAERARSDWFVGMARSDRERSTRGADEMFRMAPASEGYLAAKASLATGRATEAVERNLAMDITLPCWRNRRPRWLDMADAYHLLGRYHEELDIVRDGLARFPGYRSLMETEARALAALGQLERVDSVLRAMDGVPPQQGQNSDVGLVHTALELRAHGHPDAGARVMDHAIARLEARPPQDGRQDRARAYYWAGRWAEAEPILAQLVEESPDGWDDLGFHGATLARLGRVEEAEAASRTLGAMRRPWLRGRHIYGQTLIAAALGRNDDAIRLLERAFADYYPFGTALHVEPTFDALEDDPRWVALTTAR